MATPNKTATAGKAILFALLVLVLGCATRKAPVEHTGMGWIRVVHPRDFWTQPFIVHETEGGFIKKMSLCENPTAWKGMHVDVQFQFDATHECYDVLGMTHQPPDVKE